MDCVYRGEIRQRTMKDLRDLSKWQTVTRNPCDAWGIQRKCRTPMSRMTYDLQRTEKHQVRIEGGK